VGIASVAIEDPVAKRRGLTIDFMNGYINKSGRFVIQPQPYRFGLGTFSDGLAQVEQRSASKTLWGYAIKQARKLLRPNLICRRLFRRDGTNQSR
jgi:hypothetical protein